MTRAIETVEIDLDKKRQIVFSHRALRRAETIVNRARGVSAENWIPIERLLNSALSRGVLPADLTEILLWSALLEEDEKLTIDQVSAMITDRIYVNGKLMEACAAYWPKPKESDDGGGDRPTQGLNGSTVGSSAESKLN